MLEDIATTNLIPPGNAETGAPLPSPAHDRAPRVAFFFLWLFTVAIYARPEDIFPFIAPLHLTFILGLCSGVAYVAALAAKQTRLLWSRELRLVLLFTGWLVIGLPFSLWRGGSLQILIQVWLKTLIIFFLLTQTLVTVKRIRALLWAIILSELVVTIFSIMQSSQVTWVGERMAGVNMGILGWNFLGIAVAITIPYIAAIFVSQRSFLTTILLATASLSMLWMLVLTASRGGLLNVLLSAGLTCLLVLRGHSRGRLAGVGIVLTLFVVVSLAPQVLWQRLGTVWDNSETYMNAVQASAEESTQDRLAVLGRSIEYTLEHPIFGLGLGNFEVASGLQLGQPSAWMGTHNTFTQVSSEAGVPALALLLGLLLTAVLNMKRISTGSIENSHPPDLCLFARATLASLLAFLFGAFFAHLAYEYYLFYPVAIAVGIRHIPQPPQLQTDESCSPGEAVATNPALEETVCAN